MPNPDPSIAHRRPRLGLYGPFVLLAIVAGVWSAGWLWARGEIERRMDRTSAQMTASGYPLAWSARIFSGYPFRLDVDLTAPRFATPSGWAIAAPRLKAEAWLYAPGHWIVVAPQGVVVTRPTTGAFVVRAKVLRASLSEMGANPPRVSVEGVDLALTPAPGARPPALTSLGAFHFHARAGPQDQGAVFLELDRATAQLSGLLGRIAGGRPVSFALEGVYSHAGALQGADWRAAVRAWRAAGGRLTVGRIAASAGEAVVEARGGVLGVDADGRLEGTLSATLRQAPRALAAIGQSGAIAPEAEGAAASVLGARSRGDIAAVTVDFQAGQTTLGPAAIGPAPKVY
jgi:hypothetical protein